MGTGIFEVGQLPSRAVYLIPSGDQAAFRRAIQEASTRWGGATEPIVPVHRNGRIRQNWRQLLSVLKPDGAVAVHLSSETAQLTAASLGLPLVQLPHIDHGSPVSWTVHPTAVLPPTQTAPAPWEAPPPQYYGAGNSQPLWAVTAAGQLNEEHCSDYLRSGLAAVSLPDDLFLAQAQLLRNTVLDLTLSQFSERWARGAADAPTVIWVTLPDSLKDCLLFWNLRCLRPLRFASAPFLLIPDYADNLLGLGQQLPRLLGRSGDFEPDVSLLSESVPPSRLQDLASHLGLVPSEAQLKLGGQRYEVRSPPFTYRLGLDPRTWVFFERGYGLQTEVVSALSSEDTIVDWDSSITFVSSGYSLVRFAGAPLRHLPRRQSVACLVHGNARWVDSELQLQTSALNHYQFHLRIPDLPDVTNALLRDATTEFALSDKGRIGSVLAGSIDLEVLLRPRMYEIVCGLTTPRSQRLFRELNRRRASGAELRLAEFVENLGVRLERRYRAISQMPKHVENVRALEQLVGSGWAERGLELRCQACGVAYFVPFLSVVDEAACPGCSTSGGYTVESTGPVVSYRLNSLVDRASDQGVLPHLLVMAVIELRSTAQFLLPGVNVVLRGERSNTIAEAPEVDVFGVIDGRVAAGEVKTGAQEFTAAQVRRDIELSCRLGVDIHIMASVGQINSETRQFADVLAKRERLDLLILDSSDLRPASLGEFDE